MRIKDEIGWAELRRRAAAAAAPHTGDRLVYAGLSLGAGLAQELAFEDGSRMVINRHRAAREIWVAAPAGGFHYRWDGSAWRDSRDGAELFAALSRLVSALGGKPVRLGPVG